MVGSDTTYVYFSSFVDNYNAQADCLNILVTPPCMLLESGGTLLKYPDECYNRFYQRFNI